MSHTLSWKPRRRSSTKPHSKRRPFKIEHLETRLALDGAPDAPTWLVAPYASGDVASYSITMSVLPVAGLEYYFENTTDTSHHSTDWQSDITYVDKSLSANTQYFYRVKARVIGETEASAWSEVLSATTYTTTVATVMRVANEIRAIETFSNPNNPGQIYQALVAGGFPNPDAANNSTTCEKSGTNGLAAYPGDGRNTPDAFQVDLANVGVYDDSNPAIEQFGIWKGKAGSAKNASLYDTQIAFSQSTLKDFFGIVVKDNGLIQEIGAAAASVFLHDDAIAYSTTWVSTNNALIGLHIDAFQTEQLSLYLAGRAASDSTTGVTDTRTSPVNVMYLSQLLQYQTAKSFMYAVIQKYKNNSTYEGTYKNIQKLFGAEFQITSSTTALGVNKGEMFKCHLNDLFLLGATYVSGEGTVYGLMQAIWSAYENGTATWAATGGNITITRTSAEGQLSGAKFTFSGTPLNVSPTYPSLMHYGAVVSSLPSVDFDDATSWGIVDDGSRCIKTDADLGYTRLSATAITKSETLTTGGMYTYSEYASGQTLTLKGGDSYVIMATVFPTLTTEGYLISSNNSQTITQDQVIDISDFYTKGLLHNNTELLNSSFYVWWDGSQVSHAVRVNDPTFDFSQVTNSAYLYIVPDAQTAEGFAQMKEAIEDYSFGSSVFPKSARVLMDPKDAFGKPASADAWAEHFTTERISVGNGTIDASATTGNVLIVIDDTIETVILGTGNTVVLAASTNTAQKFFTLNAGAEVNPTLYIRSGDVIELGSHTGLTWENSDSLAYDNNATKPPYLRYSYYSVWTGKQSSETLFTFQAIVHANGNTADTDDPTKIVENALNPDKVTINRATTQTTQTSSSLLSYTVVFSQEVTDFNEDDVTLSGPAATLDGATITVANPSGDHMTYTVTITLNDTASEGAITGTISAGKVHNANGFTNLASTSTTSTSNTVNYVPNTISGQETSGSEPLPGVVITLTSSTSGFTPRTTTTNSNGEYQFFVPDGTYQVTVTPPNACINSGSETTTLTASSSQSYEADFTVGALKAAYIPNRMSVTCSLPVGSIQWQAVVQEALNLANQGAQYLTLAPQAAVAAPVAAAVAAPVAATSNVVVVATENTAHAAAAENIAPPVTSENIARPAAAATSAPITLVTVAPIVQQAITRWEEAGANQTAITKMQDATFVLSDLPALYLGMTQGTTVWIDVDAAGLGWFADFTPSDDEEFVTTASGSTLQAVDPQAVDQIDLLTVISHELGHVAGLSDSELSDLMGPLLEPGLRSLPSARDAALASI